MLPPDFPVGEYVAELPIGAARRGELIGEIEELPGRLRVLVGGMDETQRDRRYRKWTVRQIVHHLADSHVNAYVRFRLALTSMKRVMETTRPCMVPPKTAYWKM